MKTILLISALFISQFSVAATTKLPDTLHCSAPTAKSEMARSFSITGLNSDRPDSTIPDTSPLDHSIDRDYILQVSFSNECDNGYGLIFYVQDLGLLVKGKIKEVKALMNYSDAYMPENANGESSEETITVTCTL